MIRKRRYISGIPAKEKERRRNTVTTGKEILRESLKKAVRYSFCDNGTAFFNTKDGNIIEKRRTNYDNNRIYKFNNCNEWDYK